MKAIYPALMSEFNECGEVGYVIKVPDVPGCVTTANTLEDALSMIEDALSACLCVLEDEDAPINPPSAPKDIAEDGSTVILVKVDTIEYRKETDTKAVRKNVSLPSWLLYLSDKRGINCSQVLQDALKRELGIVGM